jgi:hypothetical protein
MDAFIDSGYLSSAFAILRNYVRARKKTVHFLEELVRNKTGRTPQSYPDIAFLLSAVSEDSGKIESAQNEAETKLLDQDITVKLEAAKDRVMRLTRANEGDAVAGEVLVSCLNEQSERVRVRQSRPLSPKRVTFSPDVRSVPHPAAGFASPNNNIGRQPIVVTHTSPKISQLDCLICQQKFLKRQSLMEHVFNLHKVSTRLYEVLFQTLTSESKSDLCCITCDLTFETRKLAFRHSRDVHTENFNTFIKIMAMTGVLKTYLTFFIHLDRDTPDEPVTDQQTPAADPQPKARRRSRISAPDSGASAQPAGHLINGSPLGQGSAVSSPSNSVGPQKPVSASGTWNGPLRSALKRVTKSDAQPLQDGDSDSMKTPDSEKRGRGRLPVRKIQEPELSEERSQAASAAPAGISVHDCEVSFNIRNLKNRDPVELPGVSDTLDSEMDSSNASQTPPAAECQKCRKNFINNFELNLHQLKNCKFRKPLALAVHKTRFAMKSTKPALDSDQQQVLKHFYSKTTSPNKAASEVFDSPSKSGVRMEMGARKRKLGYDSDTSSATIIESDDQSVSFAHFPTAEMQELAARCLKTDVKIFLTPISSDELDQLLESSRCTFSLNE